MKPSRIELSSLLMDIEASLRTMDLWTSIPPSETALASIEPFACDTLLFPEWLQFIFIPRVYAIIAEDARMPAVCDITPMAEEYFKANGVEAHGLLRQLRQIDQLITESD